MRRPEQSIQRAVFQHLKTRPARGVFAFHPANGGYRKPIEAKILKSCGVVAGVPDIIAIKGGHTYALELKAGRGKPTDDQRMAMWQMEQAGATVAVATGLDAALSQLEAWGLLRA